MGKYYPEVAGNSLGNLKISVYDPLDGPPSRRDVHGHTVDGVGVGVVGIITVIVEDGGSVDIIEADLR